MSILIKEGQLPQSRIIIINDGSILKTLGYNPNEHMALATPVYTEFLEERFEYVGTEPESKVPVYKKWYVNELTKTLYDYICTDINSHYYCINLEFVEEKK